MASKGRHKTCKRRDMRWVAPDGSEWASRFEWEVYDELRRGGANVRRCTERDTITYTERKPNTRCMACGSKQCVQDRTYTPDLFLIPEGQEDGSGYYIEVKGYFRREKRALFRSLRNSRQDLDIRIIYQTDFKATKKMKISEYTRRYIKDTKFHIWDGDIPGDWK